MSPQDIIKIYKHKQYANGQICIDKKMQTNIQGER